METATLETTTFQFAVLLPFILLPFLLLCFVREKDFGQRVALNFQRSSSRSTNQSVFKTHAAPAIRPEEAARRSGLMGRVWNAVTTRGRTGHLWIG